MSQAEDDRTTILMIKGAIAELPLAQQAEVNEVITEINALFLAHPETFPLAFALVGAELQAQA